MSKRIVLYTPQHIEKGLMAINGFTPVLISSINSASGTLIFPSVDGHLHISVKMLGLSHSFSYSGNYSNLDVQFIQTSTPQADAVTGDDNNIIFTFDSRNWTVGNRGSLEMTFSGSCQSSKQVHDMAEFGVGIAQLSGNGLYKAVIPVEVVEVA